MRRFPNVDEQLTLTLPISLIIMQRLTRHVSVVRMKNRRRKHMPQNGQSGLISSRVVHGLG